MSTGDITVSLPVDDSALKRALERVKRRCRWLKGRLRQIALAAEAGNMRRVLELSREPEPADILEAES